MAKVYEVGEKSMLPDEYLPDDHSGASAGPESQIIGLFNTYFSVSFQTHSCFFYP